MRQHLRDRLGDLSLRFDQLAESPVVIHRPQAVAVGGARELPADAQVVAVPPYAPLDKGVDAERRPDFGRGLAGAAVIIGGRPADEVGTVRRRKSSA